MIGETGVSYTDYTTRNSMTSITALPVDNPKSRTEYRTKEDLDGKIRRIDLRYDSD